MRQSKQILQPIIDLATGSDGGVAFVRLQVSLDNWLEGEDGSSDHQAVDIIQKFSRLCEYFLKASIIEK